MDEEKKICPKCGEPQLKKCDGTGWMEAIGPCSDGSYMTSYPCSNDNPYYETH